MSEQFDSLPLPSMVDREWAIRRPDGSIVQSGTYGAPTFWSDTAVAIVASKYARRGETSVRDTVLRVVNAIAAAGIEQDVVDRNGSDSLRMGLYRLIVNQHLSFNSPVWFNVGVCDEPQASACFINSATDSMSGILDLIKTEGMIFKSGSGAGSNLSAIRESGAPLSGGGTASGPVSFMRAFDASAGMIRSGGKTRRAAKMVVLDADHPDIIEFIDAKLHSERAARALIAAGFSSNFDDPHGAYALVPFQNANHSVRVSDAFMAAVRTDSDWTLNSRAGQPHKTVKARELFRKIAEAAHDCGDPGIIFGDTVNRWHTCPEEGPIVATNPCQPAFATVLTPDGIRTFADIDVGSTIWSGQRWTTVTAKWSTGIKTVKRYQTTAGAFVGTENHRVVSHGEKEEVGKVDCIDSCPMPGSCDKSQPMAITETTDLGEHEVFDITVDAPEHTYWTGGMLVSNCAEFMFLNDTACNLASLNLVKFLGPNGRFNTDLFAAAIRASITAQEILVGMASYPTPEIARQSRRFRPLGLGYANLGGLLMRLGLPYDSEEARDVAGAITSFMSAVAYHTSADLAARVGAFDGFDANRAPMEAVIRGHFEAAHVLAMGAEWFWTTELAHSAANIWRELIQRCQTTGFRNSQVTVLAPTGTIGLMMDCDTTGIEPVLGLTTHKQLVGGGTIRTVCPAVPDALRAIGIKPDDVPEFVRRIEAHGNSTLFAEALNEYGLAHPDTGIDGDTVEVFATAFGDRTISLQGHLSMMAAVQSFLSGAISKTVNVPHDATPEAIACAFTSAHILGLKAVAIYRDGCKGSQPLTVQKTSAPTTPAAPPTRASATRERLPTNRRAHNHGVEIGGLKLYLNVGLYADGRPGEVFLTASKQGSTIRGLLDVIAILISIALQHGVPLSAITKKLTGQRFEPSGWTGETEIPHALSIADYLGRWLGQLFGAPASAAEAPPPTATTSRPVGSGPLCSICGTPTERAGACYRCPSCGTTTGCG